MRAGYGRRSLSLKRGDGPNTEISPDLGKATQKQRRTILRAREVMHLAQLKAADAGERAAAFSPAAAELISAGS